MVDVKKLLPKLLFWAFLVWLGYNADTIGAWMEHLSLPTPAAASPAPVIVSPASTKEPPRMFFPYSGYYADHCKPALGLNQRSSEFTINAPHGSHFCVVLVNARNRAERICSIFVQSGDSVTVDVPDVEARVYYTSASASTGRWYGFDEYFGNTGSWSTSNDLFDFSEYTWEITLYDVSNGNWATESVDTNKVPFLD